MAYYCTECFQEIEDEYYVIQENHVVLALFNDVDNCFCSEECIHDFLMIDFKRLSLGDVPCEAEDD